MKQLLTVIITILLTAGILLWGNALLNSGDWWFGDFFALGTNDWTITDEQLNDFEKAITGQEDLLGNWINAEGSEWMTKENVVLCNKTNQLPKKDPVSGEIICVDAEIVETDCVWLDGEAYNLWDTKTQYKVAVKDAEQPNPECEEASFTCVNGLYITTTEDASEYNRTECIVIDTLSAEEVVTCDWNGEVYTPGEVRYNFVVTRVEQTNECRFVWFYCNGNGERWSEFDEDIYAYEECTFTEALDDEYMTVYTNELITRWLLTESDGELIIVDTDELFKVQSEWASCTTPWDEEIAHGESVLSFEDETGAWDNECVVRTSHCDDWVFLEKEPFDYPSCKIEKPESCDINGYELFHDTRKIFYNAWRYVSGKRECDDQERYCFDGEVDGDAAYKFIWCNPPVATRKAAPAQKYNAENAVCPSPYVGWGSSWKPGQTWIWYYESSVGFGGECRSVNLVCKFGTIRIGSSASYGSTVGQKFHTACSVWTPNWCSFNFLDAWAENVAHGWTISYYSSASVGFGEKCVASTASCSNGSLSASSWYKVCTPGKPAWCTSSCGSVAHGATLTTYNFASLPYGNGVTSCAAVGNAVTTSTCTNGTLSPAPGSNCSCTVEAPKACANWMAHGQTITRFNDPGCAADQFGNDLDGWSNSACQCKYGSVTCNNGNVSKTANYPWDGFPQGSCG